MTTKAELHPVGVLTITGITYAEAIELISALWGECMWGPEDGDRSAYPTSHVKAVFSTTGGKSE